MVSVYDLIDRYNRQHGDVVGQDEDYEEPAPRRRLKPERKVGVGSLGGALSVLAIWAAGRYGVELDVEVAAAFTLVATSLVSYLTPSRD